MVLIKKATDHLKQYSGCWWSCWWIGCGLPGHGNVLTLKIGKVQIQNQEKISKIWDSPQAENCMKNTFSNVLLWCWWMTPFQHQSFPATLHRTWKAVFERRPSNGEHHLLHPLRQRRGSLDPKRSSLQVAMWGYWPPSPPCCPTLWGQLAAFVEFQPKLVGGAWQVLAIQAHSSLTAVFERKGDELLWVDQTN